MFVPQRARTHDWEAISEYYDAGHTVKECRERFGFSNRAWSEAVARGDVQPRHDRSGRTPGTTREAVRLLLEAGMSRSAVARALGISKPTVTYHARALGFGSDSRYDSRYDWDGVQRYYDEGHSITECQLRFGFARKTFADAVKRGAVVSRSHGAPLETYLIADRPQSRGNLKRRLIREGLKAASCEVCGIADWRGEPLSLALHHINGDGRDNCLENLQLLCPNCHSQTENFAGRNAIRNRNGADAPV
jgi:DNA-binding CsgD family transcriptional regulator/5-methylcytosine-specific restriction endonuclease McrA